MHDNPIQVNGFTSFDALVDHLADLTRSQGLVYRLGVGALLLDAFYDGDLHAYQSRAPNKERRFEEFLRERNEQLDRIGISAKLARACVRGVAVWRLMPEPLRDALALGQLAALTRLRDANARIEVAIAALRHGWTQQQLFDAIDVVRGGGRLTDATIAAIEGDAAASSSADAAAADATDQAPMTGTLQPGRLITEAEKWIGTLDNWSRRWETVAVEAHRQDERCFVGPVRLLDTLRQRTCQYCCRVATS